MRNIFYARCLPSGQITAVGSTYLESIDSIVVTHKDEIVRELENYFEPNEVYWDDGLKFMPPKPSEYHIFDYITKQWIDPRTPETEWQIVRSTRDRLLQQSDWAALPDVPLTTEKRAEWTAYRQALRDVTLQEDPFNITWPIQPS